MADVTPLEEKLGEVIGLAEAAQEATEKVGSLLDDGSQAELVRQLNEESEETAKRAREAAESRNGEASVLEKAEETKQEGVEMMESYLDEESDGLDGFEFLTMTEAGEAGHWAILGKLNEKAGDPKIGELVEWALPLQEGHLKQVREGSLELAAEEDPEEG